MRTAADFNAFYADPDPWGVARVAFRDRALRRHLGPHIAGRHVLELGCGEGHLTKAVFYGAKSVDGMDISGVAIARAKALNLRNAQFLVADLVDMPFRGYDVIAAIEVLYYLDEADRDRVLDRIAQEHDGIVAVSAPIIGGRYFTDDGVRDLFRRHGLRLVEAHTVFPRFGDAWLGKRLTSAFIRLPLADKLLDVLPQSLVYQRLYIFRSGK